VSKLNRKEAGDNTTAYLFHYKDKDERTSVQRIENKFKKKSTLL
jgi:hypothetical protein